MAGVLDHDGLRYAVAARAQQLIARVVERALVEIRVALGVVGGQQQAAILVAHVAARVVVGGFAVVEDLVGAQQLVEALQFGVAFELVVLLVGRADGVRAGIGRKVAALAFGRQSGDIEIEQVVLPAHRPVDRLLRTLEHAELAARRGRALGMHRRAVRQQETQRRDEAHGTGNLGHEGPFRRDARFASLPKVPLRGKPDALRGMAEYRVESSITIGWALAHHETPHAGRLTLGSAAMPRSIP